MSKAEARSIRQKRLQRRQSIIAERQHRGRNIWWRRGIRRTRRAAGKAVFRLAGPFLLRLLSWSWRTERRGFENYQDLRETGSGFLAAIWHGSMLPLATFHRNQGLSVLVSPSVDGSLVAPLLRRLNYEVIRGSSNTSGTKALRNMRTQLRHGSTVVITPDGPIGPIHSMNVGLAWLARETQLPILTAAVSCGNAWHANSWDRFTIPKPGSRVVLSYGRPIHVSPDADDAELERITEDIRRQLLADEAEGMKIMGVSPSSAVPAQEVLTEEEPAQEPGAS